MNRTERMLLLGGAVAASLIAVIPVTSAISEKPPATPVPVGASGRADTFEAGTSGVRLAWLVRPRPTSDRSATT